MAVLDRVEANAAHLQRSHDHERSVGLNVRRERQGKLKIAQREARADLAAGRVMNESVDDHRKRLDAMAIGSAD
jgi:hypothetical protein